MVYIFLADGFEETEAVTPFDILKRCGADVEFCSIYKERLEVTGAHGIQIKCHTDVFNIGIDAEMFVMPGGLPGAYNLRDSDEVKKRITHQYESGKLVAAICASPTVFGLWGMLKDKTATCYPALKGELSAKAYLNAKAVRDGNVITGMGPGASSDFGFALAEALKGKKIADAVKKEMCF